MDINVLGIGGILGAMLLEGLPKTSEMRSIISR